MIDTTCFPYPHTYKGRREEGTIRPWPLTCQTCNARPCEMAPPGPVQLCSYGINYQRVDSDLLIAGVVLDDWTYSTPARRKHLHDNVTTPRFDFERAVASYRVVSQEQQSAIDDRRGELEENILDEELFKASYLTNLREEVQRGLSFFHDYDRINVQIIQNINAVIETRYDGATFEEKREKATRQEKAIYEAARFLQEKLDLARFLLRPERLARADCVRFSVHKMVVKYVRIYQSWFEAKRVGIKVSGQSYREIVADARASSVIPHALIDNALKYAPSGSEVEVFVQDEEGGVQLEVTSLGPKIESKEMRKIFRPFFRGSAAAVLEEGAGYGLYVCQLVAKEHLGSRVTVEQGSQRTLHPGFFETTFGVFYPDRAKSCVG